MDRFSNYIIIQNFKKSRTAVRDKINYAYVVAPFLYDLSLFGFFKKIVFSLFFDLHIKYEINNSNNILIYYASEKKKRPDYDYFPEYIKKILDGNCSYLRSSDNISVFLFFPVLRLFFDSWKCTAGYKMGFFKKLCCALLISKYRVISKNKFSDVLKDVRKLVTFCDAHSAENLLTQMANNCNIDTYTNQHGQYRVLDENNISSDAEAYENFISDYMFCWGDATRQEFLKAGFDYDQFIITGWIKKWECINSHEPVGVFGVMLNGESSRDSNLALLEAAKYIANELNYDYVVRLHPWSNPKSYIGFLDYRCINIGHFSLSSYLDRTDFSISHMTGATVEILHAKMPVYLLDDNKLAKVFCLKGLSYKSSEEILCAIYEDKKDSLKAKKRIEKLAQWFNEHENQNYLILSNLLE